MIFFIKIKSYNNNIKMTLFDKDNITKFIIAFSLIMVASVVGKKYKQYLDEGHQNNDNRLIKKYLLNNGGEYHSSRPLLWIHSKYEINSRAWQSFGSRNTFDLNQPYLHLTIKSIIYECGHDFNICLIDDNTFARLLPAWKVNMSAIAEPFLLHYRELGLVQLVYEYGGIVIPNSFLCFRSPIRLLDNPDTPFVCENINRGSTISLDFTPDIRFLGAGHKKNPIMGELAEFLTARNMFPHYSTEGDLCGDVAKWCMEKIRRRELKLVSAENIGAMTTKKTAIRLDNLMEENYLDISKSAIGIFIPADELLNRPAYQWFSVLSTDEIMQTTCILGKYIIKTVDKITNGVQQETHYETGNKMLL
jgi:hypothetical protein